MVFTQGLSKAADGVGVDLRFDSYDATLLALATRRSELDHMLYAISAYKDADYCAAMEFMQASERCGKLAEVFEQHVEPERN